MRLPTAKSVLCILLTLSCFHSGLAGNSSDAQSAAKPAVGNKLQGKAPATLTRGQAGEYLISFNTAQGYPSEWATLVSIDRKNLSSLSEKEISALLCGPVGSTVEIEALLSDGKLKTADLVREAVTKGSLWEHNTIAYSSYDNRSFENWNGAFVTDSLDIEARASQNLILRYANEWPEAGRKPLSEALLCAALTNYEVGNLDAGDEYLILSEKEFVPGSRWYLGQNRQLCKAVKLLTSLGRCTDAGKIIDMEAAGGTLSEFTADEAFKELVVAQLKENKLEAVATADKFPLVMKKFPSSGSLDRKWVGDAYAKCGEFKKALNSYDQVMRGYPDWDDQWQNVVSLAATVLSRAHVQDKLGRRDDAKTALEQMVKKFEAKLSRDQIAIIEKMPGVFPKLSILKSSLNGLDSGAPIPFHDDLRSLAPDYPNVRHCHDAIKRGDRVSATRLINLYLESYRGNVPEPTESDIQNLYCSILTLAREMSNHGWFETSTGVLRKLRCEAEGKDANSMARVFLLFELAYNADKLMGSGNVQWKELEENYYGTGSSQKGSKGSDLVWSERLRRLAIAFYYADELQRAEALINKALASCNKEIRNSRAITYLDGASGEKIMMLLDAACIAAKQKKFDVAEAYWKQILSLPPLCRDEFRHTVVELCSVYLASGKREKAIEMLQSIRAKPGLQAISAKEGDRNPFQAGKGVTELDLYLAKLLLDAGKAKKAYAIARAAAAKMPDWLSWPQCILVAKCSEAAGDFALAAKYYGLRKWTSSPFMFDSHVGDLPYLEKALMLADKAPRFDKAALAKLCIEVGESSSFNQPEKAYRAYKRACELIPASDPRKSDLMETIAYQKSRIPSQSLAKSGATSSRSRVGSDQLKAQEEAAILAERHHHPNTRHLWENLAFSEVEAGLIEKGLVHTRHLMQLYSREEVANHVGILGSKLGIVYFLSMKGRTADAEKLLIEAVNKTSAVAGQRSVATQAQWADLFVFYAQQKKKVQALNALDQVLKGNLTTGETLSQSSAQTHCGPRPAQATDAVAVLKIVLEALEQDYKLGFAFAQTVLQKVLTAQEKSLKPNDERIVPTLAAFGDLNFRMKKHSEAEKYYDRAYAITKKHQRGEFAVRQVGENFIANLRKLGRTAEADKLSNLKYEGVWK